MSPFLTVCATGSASVSGHSSACVGPKTLAEPVPPNTTATFLVLLSIGATRTIRNGRIPCDCQLQHGNPNPRLARCNQCTKNAVIVPSPPGIFPSVSAQPLGFGSGFLRERGQGFRRSTKRDISHAFGNNQAENACTLQYMQARGFSECNESPTPSLTLRPSLSDELLGLKRYFRESYVTCVRVTSFTAGRHGRGCRHLPSVRVTPLRCTQHAR